MTSLVLATNTNITNGTALYSATGSNEYFWLTTGVVAATNGIGASVGLFSSVDIVIDGSLVSTQTGIQHGGADGSVRIGAQGSVMALTGFLTTAVSMSGANGALENMGTIYAAHGKGISMQGGSSALVNYGQVFGETGAVQIFGGESGAATLVNYGSLRAGVFTNGVAFPDAVSVGSDGATIRNHGIILAVNSHSAAIWMAAANTVTRNYVDGTISSERGYGYNAGSVSSGVVTILNAGEISGADGSVKGGGAGTVLRNYGTLEGNVDLGFGAATFENRGQVHGNVTEASVAATNGATTVTTLRNYDTITGDVILGLGADSFGNRGTIQGNVRMGDTAGSVYAGSLGHVWGTIYGGRAAASINAGTDDDVIDISAFTSRSATGDIVRAGLGNDIIIAGNGRDALSGGGGADTFKFIRSEAAGTSVATTDTITDFAHNSDKIDLSAFMSGGSFLGTGAAFQGFGFKEVIYTSATGIVSGDVDGNGLADWTLKITPLTVLSASDFIF